MPDVQSFLTRKIGPLPLWAWAGAGGGLVAILYLRGQGQATSPAPPPGAANSGQGLFAPSPIIVTPQSMPASTSSANPAPAAPSSGTNIIAGSNNPGLQQYGGSIPLYMQRPNTISGVTYGATVIGTVPAGTPLTQQGTPIQVPWGTSTATLIPINFLGQTGVFVSAQDVTYQGSTGMGGASSTALRTLPNAGKVGRFTSRHAHPQFLAVSGMGGGGRRGLAAVSKRTGLPEERLMALNPGHWRPTPGGQPRHIHIR